MDRSDFLFLQGLCWMILGFVSDKDWLSIPAFIFAIFNMVASAVIYVRGVK